MFLWPEVGKSLHRSPPPAKVTFCPRTNDLCDDLISGLLRERGFSDGVLAKIDLEAEKVCYPWPLRVGCTCTIFAYFSSTGCMDEACVSGIHAP